MKTMVIGVILGHRLSDDGTGSPILISRLETALFAEEKIHPDRWIVSGGTANPQAGIPEAAVMRDYLVAHGIPTDRILLEDQSRNTKENARYSIRLALKYPVGSLLLITSPEHLTRWYLNPMKLFAKEIGLRPISLMVFSGRPTDKSFQKEPIR